jgi:hypothetical protein
MTARPEPNVDALVETVGVALHDGFDYFGHELDDVTGRVHAISPQAKKYEAAITDLAALARANSARDQLLHDAMDALGQDQFYATGRDAKRTDQIRALFARFRALNTRAGG